MSEYSRGPWITIQNPTNISIATGSYESGGRQVAFVQCKSNKRVARANADILASAPELLDALMALRSFMWAEGYADQNLPMAQADAAIANAEGR